MATFEKPAAQGRDGEHSHASLPALRHRAFSKHWHAVDDGGAELMTVAFGASRRQPPRRFAPIAPPPERPVPPAPQPRQITPPPGRLPATVLLLLFVLAILFAEPAARLFTRVLAVRADTAGATAMSATSHTDPFVDKARRTAARAAGS